MEGRKDDASKPYRFELIAPEFLFGISAVLTRGAQKYGDRNWESGMKWGRCFGAMMRHMWAWWGGRGPTTKSFLFGDLDDEWNFSHLWHAACCLMFLVAYEERGSGEDDRFRRLDKQVADLLKEPFIVGSSAVSTPELLRRYKEETGGYHPPKEPSVSDLLGGTNAQRTPIYSEDEATEEELYLNAASPHAGQR